MAVSVSLVGIFIISLCFINPSQEACPTAYPVLTGDPRLPDESLTASSIYKDGRNKVVGALGPKGSRLRSTAHDQAWAAEEQPSGVAEYIQVDLGYVNRIVAIATQGRANSDQWVTQYYIKLSNDGSAFHNYTDNGAVKLFTGNTDRSTVMNHTLQDTPEARYVRLYATQWKKQIIALRWEVYICSACLTPQPLLSGDPSVPDESFIASSTLNNEVASRYSRFISTGWAAQHNQSGEYIQVDLLALRTIHSIATQGSSTAGQWITSYYIALSADGVNFRNYNENENLKTFTGNRDKNAVVQHLLQPNTRTRYVRLYPKQWHGHIALRWEVYSCLTCTAVHPVLSGDPKLPDASLSASSFWSNDIRFKPIYSRLHTISTNSNAGAWVAGTQNVGQYIQVDLRALSMLHSIATQGRQEYDEWVSEYYLMFSEDGTNFYNYTHNDATKTFSGNKDRNTLVRHHILHFKPVRYIRLLATKRVTHITLRWDVYTCSNCLAGTYGRDCSLPCHCSGATPLCYEFSGQCVGDCQPGWYGDTCQIENKAYNKATKVSGFTTFSSNPLDGSKAVDGSSSSDTNSCFEANGTAEQWLEVDLGGPVRILRVWMLNRDQSHTANRLQQVTVRVSNNSRSSGGAQPVCFDHILGDISPSDWLRGTCDLTGRYVSVIRPSIPNVGPLTICELVVISKATPKPRPDAVRNLRVTSQQTPQATVVWDAPYWTYLALYNNRVSLHATGIYCRVSSSPYITLNQSNQTKLHNYTFRNLRPGMKHVIGVTPSTLTVEGGGVGQMKSTVEFTTSDGSVPMDSITVTGTATTVTSRSLTVTWSPPNCNLWGAPFKHYKVKIEQEQFVVIADYNNIRYTFSNRIPHTDYTVTVFFVTNKTVSTPVTLLSKTQPENPDKPQSISLSNKNLSWGAPLHMNGDFRYYIVTYTHVPPTGCSAPSVGTKTTNETGTSVVLTDLLGDSLYDFTVVAVNHVGLGNATRLNQTRTASDATHKHNIKPVNVRVIHNTSTSVTLVWSPPPCRYWGYPFSKYSLEVFDLTRNSWLSPISTISATSFKLTSLKPYTDYRFDVYFHTTNTKSNQESVPFTSLPDKPGKPTGFQFNGKKVAWMAPSVLNGTLRHYIITYTRLSVSGCDNTTVAKNENTTNTDITLLNLKSASLYNISVVTVNNWGRGDPETITQWTAPETPNPPRNLSGSLINATAATFYWDSPPCHDIGGFNLNFSYKISEQGKSVVVEQATTPDKNVTINGVVLNSNYILRVQLETSGGKSAWEVKNPVVIEESIPGVPYGVEAFNITASSFSISWSQPRDTNGLITEYKVNCTGTRLSISIKNYTASITTHTEENLDAASDFPCYIQAATSKGFGSAKVLEISTQPRKAAVRPPTVEKSTATTATFVIPAVTDPLPKYWLVAVEEVSKRRRRQISPAHTPFPTNSYITLNISTLPPSGRVVVGDNSMSNNGVWNKPLVHGKIYNLHVAAATVYRQHVVYGGATVNQAFQAVVRSYSPPPPTTPRPVAIYAGAAAGGLVLLVLAVVLVVLWKRGAFLRRKTKKENPDTICSDIATDGAAATSAPARSEYANPAAIRKKKKKNKEKDHPIYLNEISIRDRDPPDGASQQQNAQAHNLYENVNRKENPKPAAPLKPKLATSSVTVPISPEPNEPMYMPAGLSLAVGVPVDEFIEHVHAGKANNKEVFLEDYGTLPQKLIKPAVAGYLPENKCKNRYKDIIPYDQTRVILQNHVTDYVNASHIVGYTADQKHIAAQAPNKSSLADFLVLLWQEKVGVIVMLNNVFENGKKRCEEYWPAENGGEVKAQPIIVTMSRVERRNHYTVRHLNLKHNNGDERVLKQYHYTAWPDFGVPALTSGLVQLRNDVRKTHGNQLLLVHCSAGVGRTGSFISLDLLLERGPRLPVLQTVELLRQQRSIMVQTIAQYVFLHDALAESLVGGQSSFSGHQFTDWVASRDFADKSQAQHQVLALMKAPDSYYERDENAPASGMRRVELTSSVNADVMNLGEVSEEMWVVEGRDASLETGELWQSFIRNSVTTVALITSNKEEGEWTTVGQQKILTDGVTLECKSKQDITRNLVRATIDVTSDADDTQIYANVSAPSKGESGQVTVVQLTSPQSVSDLAALIQLLVEGSKPLVFANTTPSASVVAAATATVARARRLQEVDVYSTAKKVVLALPVLMPNLENYRLILRVVAEYLQQNSEYANFQ